MNRYVKEFAFGRKKVLTELRTARFIKKLNKNGIIQ
jgi:hypothetical protein